MKQPKKSVGTLLPNQLNFRIRKTAKDMKRLQWLLNFHPTALVHHTLAPCPLSSCSLAFPEAWMVKVRSRSKKSVFSPNCSLQLKHSKVFFMKSKRLRNQIGWNGSSCRTGSVFKYRHTPYGLRGEGLNLELPKFNLKFKKNSFTYSLTKSRNSLPSQVRRSSEANDFRSKLRDCSVLEGLLVRTSEVNCTIAVF